jgi:hypothetical protein
MPDFGIVSAQKNGGDYDLVLFDNFKIDSDALPYCGYFIDRLGTGIFCFFSRLPYTYFVGSRCYCDLAKIDQGRRPCLIFIT